MQGAPAQHAAPPPALAPVADAGAEFISAAAGAIDEGADAARDVSSRFAAAAADAAGEAAPLADDAAPLADDVAGAAQDLGQIVDELAAAPVAAEAPAVRPKLPGDRLLDSLFGGGGASAPPVVPSPAAPGPRVGFGDKLLANLRNRNTPPAGTGMTHAQLAETARNAMDTLGQAGAAAGQIAEAPVGRAATLAGDLAQALKLLR